MIWRQDNSSPSASGRICSTEGRPNQERRRILILIARFKEVAMRWECPGNLLAEMFFNLVREVAGEGQASR